MVTRRLFSGQIKTSHFVVLVASILRTAMMSASQEHQGEKRKACVNPGNPVFSCMMAAADVLPALRANHPLFRTTSSEYGRLPPSFESSPCTFHRTSNKFSKDLIKSGMYRDNSFNTALDRSRVYDSPHLQHTL